ncbi:MAG: sulfatase [Verrucomicrobiota bacterium]
MVFFRAFLLSLLWIFPAHAARQPNLIIIQTDEHNFRTLGCYRNLLSVEQGHMWGKNLVVETPHIDALARRGVLCTSFYATTPVCGPSRAALITGRYPQNTGVVQNNNPLSDHMITFARILKEQGYATGYIGKWHLEGDGKPQWAPPRKFGFEDNRYMFNRGHWKQFEDTPNGPRVKARDAGGNPSYSVKGADEQSFATDYLMERAGEFIARHREKPLCLMVSLPDPHGPDTVRAPYDTMYTHMKFEKPRTFAVGEKEGDVPRWAVPSGRFQNMAIYYGMVKCIDDRMGELVSQLKELDLLENTVLVFTSDHGDLRGEHHRQNKGVPFEASARIPFIISYPAKLTEPKVVDEALTCVDFLPTVLPIMGVRTAGKEQGRDASSLFLPGAAEPGWEDVAFMRGTGSQSAWVSAVSDRYKLVLSPFDTPWLFDLQEDPDELKNFFLEADRREVVRTLSKALLDYGKRYGDPVLSGPAVRADLEWGAGGEGAYVAPNREKRPSPSPLKRKLNNAKKRKNKSAG